jgi:hypothetical protein
MRRFLGFVGMAFKKSHTFNGWKYFCVIHPGLLMWVNLLGENLQRNAMIFSVSEKSML